MFKLVDASHNPLRKSSDSFLQLLELKSFNASGSNLDKTVRYQCGAVEGISLPFA
jgi:hypothetical protein